MCPVYLYDWTPRQYFYVFLVQVLSVDAHDFDTDPSTYRGWTSTDTPVPPELSVPAEKGTPVFRIRPDCPPSLSGGSMLDQVDLGPDTQEVLDGFPGLQGDTRRERSCKTITTSPMVLSTVADPPKLSSSHEGVSRLRPSGSRSTTTDQKRLRREHPNVYLQ